jgi:hypothetical protein
MASQSHKLKIAGVWVLFVAFLIAALTVALRLTSEFSSENDVIPAPKTDLPELTPKPSLMPASPPSPTSTPTPETSPIRAKSSDEEPINFTPSQIMKKIDSEMFESQKEHMRKSFIGLPVDWTLSFSSTSEIPKGSLVVYFKDSSASSFLPLVAISVPLKGNERLPLTEDGKKFRVKGVIDSIDPLTIRLRKETFEPSP